MSRFVVAVVAAVCALTGLAGSASADARLGLSVDRQTWTDTIRGGLFDSQVRWVPGDRRTETFYVRNQSEDTVDMVVAIQGTQDDSLIETGDLTVTARGGAGTWMPVDSPGDQPLLHVPRMQPGETESVDVTVALGNDAANDSKSATLNLGLEVRLEQRADSGDAQVPLLPDTGGVRLALLLLAAGLIGLGAAVLRRPQQETHDV